MTAVIRSLPSHAPRTAEGVLAEVNALVDHLRSRASETERLRRMHPDNLRDLTEAGVFRLTMPTDVGGYQADEDTVAEVLAQISRGCPSTGWMCTIMVATNVIPALLADEAGDEIYATPDLRMTAAIAPTGQATPVDGGYRVTAVDVEHRRRTQQLVRRRVRRARRGGLGTAPDDAAHHRSGPSGQLARSWDGRHGYQHRNGQRRVRPGGALHPVQRPRRGSVSVSALLALPYFNRPWVMFINASAQPRCSGWHAERWTASCRHCQRAGPSP